MSLNVLYSGVTCPYFKIGMLLMPEELDSVKSNLFSLILVECFELCVFKYKLNIFILLFL